HPGGTVRLGSVIVPGRAGCSEVPLRGALAPHPGNLFPENHLMAAVNPNNHLSEEQITRYRQRALAPGELVEIDDHLSVCPTCHAQCWEESQREDTLARAAHGLQ